MSDDEDPAASLGDSEILSVKNPPGQPIPALGERLDNRLEYLSLVNKQDIRHILPDEPDRLKLRSQSDKLQRKISPRVAEAQALPGNGE
jgi:hypothetical protein